MGLRSRELENWWLGVGVDSREIWESGVRKLRDVSQSPESENCRVAVEVAKLGVRSWENGWLVGVEVGSRKI